MNDVFGKYDVQWDARVTHRFGDATRLAQEAVAAGVDLVAAYGGDGTQMEVANALIGADAKMPMAMLPGGNGNSMALELKIPRRLAPAVELICTSHNRRAIDVVRIGERFFMLSARVAGEETPGVSREMKDQYGMLAYRLADAQKLAGAQASRFRLTIDGERIEGEGVECYIVNSGTLGKIGGTSDIHIDVSDGLLDVYLFNRDVDTFTAAGSRLLRLENEKANLHHWQGREITVEAESPQKVWTDGEFYGGTPVTVSIVHHAIEVVVP